MIIIIQNGSSRHTDGSMKKLAARETAVLVPVVSHFNLTLRQAVTGRILKFEMARFYPLKLVCQ